MAAAIPNDAGFSRWVYVVWGILSLIAGFFLFTRPAVTALVLIEVMAIFWIVGGIFDFVRAIAERGDYWGWQIVAAIIGIIAGIYIIANPMLGTVFTIRIAYIILAVYSVIAGIMNIVFGFKNPEGTTWSAIIIGAIQVVVGTWLLFNWYTGLGILVFVPVVAIFMIVGGIFAIIASFFVNQAGTPGPGTSASATKPAPAPATEAKPADAPPADAEG